MNLKQRFSFIFSCLFSAVLAAVMLPVYFLFAEFRHDEFADRMAEKAQTTAKILVEVKEIDYNTQKIIDRNSINKLYNEKTEVFDADQKPIYSSHGSLDLNWTRAEMNAIKQQGRVFKMTSQSEVLGLYYKFDNEDYYVLISAEDKYGNRKLNYLKYLLVGAFLAGTTAVWLLSFSVSKKSLQPLDNFRKQIQEITDNNLTIRLSKAKREDEINALANSFNQMMDRIDNAYNRQREFTGNASHELRTPVARIAAQLENLVQTPGLDNGIKNNLSSIAEDVFQLSEIISSLVTLADVNNRQHNLPVEKLRLDELVFSAAAQLGKTYTDFRFKFEIENTTSTDTDLEITGDEILLKIVLLNLFKNAYLYSDDRLLQCIIIQKPNAIELKITNTGHVPDVADTAALFTTFYRGSNTKHIPGSGIGLSIVWRVLQYHKAQVAYNVPNQNTNQVTVTFPLKF